MSAKSPSPWVQKGHFLGNVATSGSCGAVHGHCHGVLNWLGCHILAFHQKVLHEGQEQSPITPQSCRAVSKDSPMSVATHSNCRPHSNLETCPGSPAIVVLVAKS